MKDSITSILASHTISSCWHPYISARTLFLIKGIFTNANPTLSHTTTRGLYYKSCPFLSGYSDKPAQLFGAFKPYIVSTCNPFTTINIALLAML